MRKSRVAYFWVSGAITWRSWAFQHRLLIVATVFCCWANLDSTPFMRNGLLGGKAGWAPGSEMPVADQDW